MNDGSLGVVRIPIRLWRIIDGTIDNAVSTTVVDGGHGDLVSAGNRIRKAGWRQIGGWVPGDPSSSWPPDEKIVPVVLRATEWNLVLTLLDQADSVLVSLDDEQGIQLGRAARQIVRDQRP